MMNPWVIWGISSTNPAASCRGRYALAALFPLVIIAGAQGQTGSNGAAVRESPILDTTKRSGTHSTAEEILSALQQTRPTNEVILSESLLARPASVAHRLVLPEGFRILNQIGLISPDGDGWVLHRADSPGLPPIRLLSNRTLEQMVRTTTGADSPTLFSVSGELTLFRGENFLLPRVAARYHAPSVPTIASPPMEDTPLLAVAGTDDVLTRLRAEHPEHEVLTVSPLGRNSPVSNMLPSIEPPGDGMPLAQRPGRVWGQADQWTFTFESAADHPADLPLRLLPSQHLERMIGAVENSTMPLIFIVSGEIAVFDGSSYLLVRAAARRVSGGSLGK